MEILGKIEEWIQAETCVTKLLWLHGPAGAGKSAIAQTVAETCAERGQLAASFFFSRSSPGRDALKHLSPTITVQISMSSLHKRQKFRDVLQDDPYITHRVSGSIDLLVSLFSELPGMLAEGQATLTSPFLIIIDGLDECQGNNDQSAILDDVYDLVDKHRLPLRILITSRPESHIRERFDQHPMSSVTKVVSIYGDFFARRDVMAYLRDEFRRIRGSQRHRDIMQFVSGPWPSDRVIKQIAERSGGYFIYAATVIKYVDEEYFSCLDRLDQVLGTSSAPHGPEGMPFAELDNLYRNVLSACPTSQLPLLKRVLPFLQLYAEVSTTEAFLGLRPGQLNLTLRGLRSIVDVDVGRLRSFHASFFDFLFDPSRAKYYYVDVEQWHASNFHRLFSLVNPLMSALDPNGIRNMFVSIVVRLMKQTIDSHHSMRYNPRQIETCIMQCSRQGSKISSFRCVIAASFQGRWSKDLSNGSFQGSFRFAATLLVRMINVLQVCMAMTIYVAMYCDLISIIPGRVHTTRHSVTC